MSADNERFTLDTNLLVYAIDSAAGARMTLRARSSNTLSGSIVG
jgi:hypothetical protein